MRRQRHDAKRCSAHADDQAVFNGLDRACDIPKGQRSGKNVSEHRTDSIA
jgi:hypothetical protein